MFLMGEREKVQRRTKTLLAAKRHKKHKQENPVLIFALFVPFCG
jgi:hypothetical protein